MAGARAVLARMSPIERLAVLVSEGSVESYKEWRERFSYLYNESKVPSPLRRGQSVAVDLDGQTKVSSLFFDRIMDNPFDDDPPPEKIRFHGGTDAEFFALWVPLLVPDDSPNFEERISELIDFVMGNDKKRRRGNSSPSINPARGLCYALWAEKGIEAVPVYSSDESRNLDFTPGRAETILAAITNLSVIDNDALSWRQVMEFRKDKQALLKLRRLRGWLDREMAGKPISFVSDAIAIKLDEYEWALRKHGVKTVTGAMSQLLDAKVLGTAATAVGGLTFLGANTLGILAGSGIVLGRAAISVAGMLTDLGDIKRSASADVAFVHQIKALAG